MSDRFHNPRPLTLASEDLADAFESIDLHAVPVVDDFRVELRETADAGSHVDYVSAAHGLLATFPAWDHAERDLRHFNPTDVPFGSIETPYDDADEEWRLVIFGRNDFVYIFEGDAPHTLTFPRYFRVARDRYFAQWATLMDLFNPTEELDA